MLAKSLMDNGEMLRKTIMELKEKEIENHRLKKVIE